jgi:Ubinuclein conserved middle domain
VFFFSIETASRNLGSLVVRHQIYLHLAQHLPFTKQTLQSRAKKIRIQSEENKLTHSVKKLKILVNEMMPSVLETHEKECEKVKVLK